MGIALRVDSRCETRKHLATDENELWLFEVVDRKSKSVRLRHLKTHKYLGLTEQNACLVSAEEEQKYGTVAIDGSDEAGGVFEEEIHDEIVYNNRPQTHFIIVPDPEGWWSKMRLKTSRAAEMIGKKEKGSHVEFQAEDNPRLGFHLFIHSMMSARGVSGRVMFYRRNTSDQRVPLPFPSSPSLEALMNDENGERDTQSQSRGGSNAAEVDSKYKDVQGSSPFGYFASTVPSGEQETENETGNSTKATCASNNDNKTNSGHPNQTLPIEDRARLAIIEEMFDKFDINGDGKLDENEMSAFAREVCNFPSSWAFDNWWNYILFEYAPSEDGVENGEASNLDFEGFKLFIEDRPNKDDICRYFLARKSGRLQNAPQQAYRSQNQVPPGEAYRGSENNTENKDVKEEPAPESIALVDSIEDRINEINAKAAAAAAAMPVTGNKINTDGDSSGSAEDIACSRSKSGSNGDNEAGSTVQFNSDKEGYTTTSSEVDPSVQDSVQDYHLTTAVATLEGGGLGNSDIRGALEDYCVAEKLHENDDDPDDYVPSEALSEGAML